MNQLAIHNNSKLYKVSGPEDMLQGQHVHLVRSPGTRGTHLWLDHAVPHHYHPHLQQFDHPRPQSSGYAIRHQHCAAWNGSLRPSNDHSSSSLVRLKS